MLKGYGTTQVCEVRLTDREAEAIVKENIASRFDPSYDFDRKNPLLLRENGEWIIWFVQCKVTHEKQPLERATLAPLGASEKIGGPVDV